MFGILLGAGLGIVIGFIFWLLRPLTYIKQENVVIKLLGKKTVVPISDIQTVKGVDMMRGGYQVTIYAKNNGIYYGTVSMWETITEKVRQFNTEV